jgi:hypothetical protein
MTFDQWISMVASLGTLLAALATVLVVLEMRKQRDTAYRPELTIFGFKVETDPSRRTGYLDSFCRWKGGSDQAWDFPELEFRIRVVNIGMGVAKNVKYRWSFDFEGAVRMANELGKKYGSRERWDITKNVIGHDTTCCQIMLDEELDCVLPSGSESEPMYLYFPFAYTFVVSGIMYESAHVHAKTTDYVELPEIPPLHLEMKYDDISGKKHRVFYVINLNVSTPKLDGFMGYIDPMRTT